MPQYRPSVMAVVGLQYVFSLMACLASGNEFITAKPYKDVET